MNNSPHGALSTG